MKKISPFLSYLSFRVPNVALGTNLATRDTFELR